MGNEEEFEVILSRRKLSCNHSIWFYRSQIKEKKTSDVQLSERFSTLGIVRVQLKDPQSSQHYGVEGFKGFLNWGRIMPTDASRTESFFQSDTTRFVD